jgi:hypothetical protein
MPVARAMEAFAGRARGSRFCAAARAALPNPKMSSTHQPILMRQRAVAIGQRAHIGRQDMFERDELVQTSMNGSGGNALIASQAKGRSRLNAALAMQRVQKIGSSFQAFPSLAHELVQFQV